MLTCPIGVLTAAVTSVGFCSNLGSLSCAYFFSLPLKTHLIVSVDLTVTERKMLSLNFYLNLTFLQAVNIQLCALKVSKFNIQFLKTQLFVFVGPGWNKNLYSAGAWGPELRTTTQNLLTHTHTFTHTRPHPRTHTHPHRQTDRPVHATTNTFAYICDPKQWGTGERWYAACLDQSTRLHKVVFIFYILDLFFYVKYLKKTASKQ